MQTRGVLSRSESNGFVLPGCTAQHSKVRHIIVVWQAKSNLLHVVWSTMKVMGRTEDLSLQSINDWSVIRQGQTVLSDISFILSSCLLAEDEVSENTD